MPFVERDRQGNIVGVYARPQKGRAEENVRADAAEVVAFRNRKRDNPLADEARAANSVPALRDVVLKLLGEVP